MRIDLNAAMPTGPDAPPDHVTTIRIRNHDTGQYLGCVSLTAAQVVALIQPRAAFTVTLEETPPPAVPVRHVWSPVPATDVD